MSEHGEPLSERETEILRLVATGAANKEIAVKLSISPNTVKVHLRSIFAKIGVASRTEATLFAIRSGIVPRENALLGDAPTALDNREEIPASEPPAPILPEGESPSPGWRGVLRALQSSPRSAVILASAFLLLLIISVATAAALLRPPEGSVPTQAAQPSGINSTQRWQKFADLPTARRGMAVASSEDAIYLIGGATAQGISPDVQRYLPLSNRWESLPPKPTPSADIHAAILGEKIYVPGGRLPDGSVSDVLEVFDPRRGQWETRARLPQPLSGYALVAFEGRLYLFGGWDGKDYSAAVFEYDPARDAWQGRSPIKSARAFSAAAAGRDRIYLMGGFDGQQVLDSNLVYYPNRAQSGESAWEERARMPQARFGMGSSVLANLIYLVGGAAQPQKSTNPAPTALPMLEYVPQSDLWLVLETPPLEIGNQPAVSAFGNFLHIFGGESKSSLSPLHQVYQAIYTIGIPVLKDQ